MSVLQMAMVWKCQLAHNQQSVLLALADHADDDGTNCYPAMGYIAWKTDYSVRQVRRVVKQLRDIGALVILDESRGQGRPVHYQVNLAGLPRKPEYMSDARGRMGDTDGNGANLSPMSHRVEREDGSAPLPDTIGTEARDTGMSDKPSVTINEPSGEPSMYAAWLTKLRGIDGWNAKGEPHLGTLLVWIGEKGWTDQQLEASAIGLAATSSKTLKGYRDMAAAYQRRLNQGYDDPTRQNGTARRGAGALPHEPAGQAGGARSEWDNRS